MNKREPDFVDECYADKDLTHLQRLTLVIPTYNRNYYLSRCLWYHSHFPFGEIIVADSSPEEKRKINRETVEKIRSLFGANIRYLEYEPETDKYGGDIYRKWGDAVQHVETEYSIICIDKAFLAPDWLISAEETLENNLNYVSVYGASFMLRLRGSIFNQKKYILSRFRDEDFSIHSSSPSERMSQAIVGRAVWRGNQLFSLTRTNIHKKIHNLITEYSICDVRYGELVLGYSGNIFGQTYYLSGIDVIRDICEFTKITPNKRLNNKESSDSRYPHFLELAEISNTYYDNFITCLNGELEKLDQPKTSITFEDIRKFDNRTGSRGQNMVNRHPHLYQIWFNWMPCLCQNIILAVVKKIAPSFPRPSPLIPVQMAKEFILVAKIVSESSEKMEKDEAVI